jgi:phage replication initiation protein
VPAEGKVNWGAFLIAPRQETNKPAHWRINVAQAPWYQRAIARIKCAQSYTFFEEVKKIPTNKSSTNNVIGKVDWLQIIFESTSWRVVFSQILMISLDCVTSEPASLKHETYDIMYSCGSIRYYTTDSLNAERGTLVMSGQACTMYEWGMLATDTERNVFQDLATRILDLATSCTLRFDVTRLDLALDDYNTNPFFTVDLIIGKISRKQFLSKGRSVKVVDSEFDKRTRAKTQEIGSRGSDCMFRIYEKGKELAKGLSGTEREAMLESAPKVRLEAETRHDVAKSLLMAIAYMNREQTLSNLIRGFVKTELTFYTDTNYTTVNRWWMNYLKPCYVPAIQRQKPQTDFDKTLHWYEYQGGLAVSEAIYFLVEHGIILPPTLLLHPGDYLWNSELANKMIDFVTVNDRPDLIPLIQERIKKPLTSGE